ncbi:MAG: imidazole glycerol phosphate synthase subunit HisH [Thermodesulfobacteriota bacterium]
MIAIIDYDMGNLRSVEKALAKLGSESVITRDAQVIADATHVVLPGVGAFKDCMHNLEEYGLIDPIKKAVNSGKPFLGICIGLQLLFDESSEQGTHFGLGIIKGKVVRFPAPHHTEGSEFKIPHMGWNAVKASKASALLEGTPDGEYFYFVHSYYAKPEDQSVTLTTTQYGEEFASSIEHGNVMACQFHPEKSQRAGLKLLENFRRLS